MELMIPINQASEKMPFFQYQIKKYDIHMNQTMDSVLNMFINYVI